MPEQTALYAEHILARRDALPLKPAPVVLEGRFVRLIPLDLDRDVETLFRVSNGSAITLGERAVPEYDADELIWRWMFAGPFGSADELREHLQAQVNAANGLPYTVFDLASGSAVGVANYINNAPRDLKIELGSIWYGAIAQRTNANLEATYLLLRQAFDLGYLRLEWKCDARNERSRRSALRMGFQFEGIQDAHMIVKNQRRDTSWYRILADEWPGVKQHLEVLLQF